MISATILTKNSQKYLREVLKSLSGFEEILVYDTGSSDRTLEIAASFSNVSLRSGPFEGFGKTHNRASSLAKNDWIFSVDSDELLSDELKEEIRGLRLDPRSIYSVPRKNFFRGKWIRCCGWHPDRVFRLYHRKEARFSSDEVHERLIGSGLKRIKLSAPLLHYPYSSARDFLHKMQIYSDLFAKQQRGKRRSSVGKALVHSAFAFFKSYFLQRGFLGGAEGLIISRYQANTAFYKYIKLAEEGE